MLQQMDARDSRTRAGVQAMQQTRIAGSTMTKLMTKTELIHRRYEAMRMRWPEKIMDLCTQEMLLLAWAGLNRKRRAVE